MQQLMQVGKQASATLEQTTALMRNANGLLSDQGKQVRQRRAGDEVAGAKQRNHQHLLTNNKDSVNSGMQGLNELAPAVRELRETLGSLRAISRRLEAPQRLPAGQRQEQGVHAMKRAYRLIAPVALAALVSACSILPKAEPRTYTAWRRPRRPARPRQ
jgi:ABC-type transporter Mla subunit MlaD